MIRRITILVCLIASFNVSSAFAQWTLNNDNSQLSFVSIKAGNIGEVHKFGQLTGELTTEGQLTVEVELASVDTLIPIRDDRMQQLLFETDIFPKATFTASIDMAEVNAVEVGSSKALEISGDLKIRDRTTSISPKVMVTRIAEGAVLVNTLQPLLLNADAVGLTDGVEKLREIAGLPSISSAVPVTFVLTFNG